MSNTKKTPRPASPSGQLGHGYCWEKHPVHGVRCTQPAGHTVKGVEHLHPYTRPPLRWP